MKYSDKKVEKLIDMIVNMDELICPSSIELTEKDCETKSCEYCWQQALAGDD